MSPFHTSRQIYSDGVYTKASASGNNIGQEIKQRMTRSSQRRMLLEGIAIDECNRDGVDHDDK